MLERKHSSPTIDFSAFTSSHRKLVVIDYLGTVLSLAGSTLIILPLIWVSVLYCNVNHGPNITWQGGVTFPWNSPEVVVSLFGGIFVVALFCVWEWKGAKLPIVPSKYLFLSGGYLWYLLVYIFRYSTVIGVYTTMFAKWVQVVRPSQASNWSHYFSGFVFFSSIYYVPQFLQVVIGDTPVRAGMYLIPYLVGQMAASWVSVRYILPTPESSCHFTDREWRLV